jgi:membrane fusion protein (multidrug efflux system)
MRSIPRALIVGGACLAVTCLACSKPAPQAPPPPEVSVVTVTPASVQDNLEFVGDVQALRTVQVRAQAVGVIMARPFREGAQVHAGDVLYRIDPTTADADWRSAKARLADAEARYANSQISVNRLRPLLEGNAVAKADVDNAEAALQQARAAVEDARAAVDRTRKLLDETVVRAEISGRVGRALLDLGTRVSGVDDILTTIDVTDPLYVSFRPSAQQQLSWQRDPAAWRAIQPGGTARVQVVLPDGSVFPTLGTISFIDPVVDPRTGTRQYRAKFANPDHLLIPGQFVRVRLQGIRRDNAVLIPQRAVQQQMGRAVVYVVGKGDTVATRDVTATEWAGTNWLIESGLSAGDRVVVDGLQKIRPGIVVHPSPLVDSTATVANSVAASAAPPSAHSPARPQTHSAGSAQ